MHCTFFVLALRTQTGDNRVVLFLVESLLHEHVAQTKDSLRAAIMQASAVMSSSNAYTKNLYHPWQVQSSRKQEMQTHAYNVSPLLIGKQQAPPSPQRGTSGPEGPWSPGRNPPSSTTDVYFTGQKPVSSYFASPQKQQVHISRPHQHPERRSYSFFVCISPHTRTCKVAVVFRLFSTRDIKHL